MDRSQFSSDLDAAKAEADRKFRDPVKVKITAENEASAEMDKVAAAKKALGGTETVKVKADTAEASTDLDKVEAKKAAVGKDVTVKVKTESDTSGLDDIGKKVTELKDGPFSALKTAIVGLGPAAVPVLGGITAAVAPLAGAIGSAAIGLGAFGVIVKQVIAPAEKATAAVQKAQLSYNTAIAQGTKQATAFKTEQTAIAKAYQGMSQQQLALSDQLSALTAGWQGALKSVTPLVSSAVVPWLKDIRQLLQYIKPLIAPIATDFQAWGIELGKTLSANQGKLADFFGLFGARSAGNIASLGDALISFAKGAGALIHDIAPELGGAANGVAGLAASFAKWAGSQQAANDIKGFFTWARAAAPEVKQLLDALGGSLGNLIKAAAYSGGGDLKVLTIALQGIAALPAGAIVALADAFLAVSISLRAISAVQGIASLATNVGNFAKGLGDSEAAASKATGAMGTFGGAVSTIGGKIGGAASSVASFAASIATSVAKSVASFAVMAARAIASAAVTVASFAAEAAAATAAFIAENIATLGIVAGIAVLVAAVIYLATHWKQVWGTIKAVIVDVWNWIKDHWPLLVSILGGPVGAAVAVILTHWQAIEDDAKAVWNAIKSFFTGWWNAEVAAFRSAVNTVKSLLSSAWDAITSAVKSAWNAIKSWFTSWWNANTALFRNSLNTAKSVLNNAWDAINSALRSAWNAIRSFFSNWWNANTALVRGALNTVKSVLSSGWNAIYSTVKNVWGNIRSWFSSFWSGLESGFRTAVSKIKTIWHGFQNAISAPVNWVIHNVYDKYIVRFWDDVAGAVGLPKLPKLAEGGIVPGGYSPVDNQLVWMRSGEGVLQPGAVAALGGEPFINWANSTYGDLGGGQNAPGHFALGGIFHDIGSLLSSPIREVLSIGKVLEHAVDDGIMAPFKAITRILVHDLSKIPGAKSDGMVSIMEKMPLKMWDGFINYVSDHLPSFGGGGGKSGPGSAKGNAITQFAERYLGTPYVFGGTQPGLGWDCSGFTEFVYDHFGWTPPRTSEEQFGWVKRIADPIPGALAFFTGSPIDPPPGHVGIVTSPDTMIDAYGTGYGTIYNSIYGSSGTVMGFGIPPSGFKFDDGGWLQPGATLVVNTTGKPEPVLTGEQWDLMSTATGGGELGGKLDRIANLLAAGPRATGAALGEVVNGSARSASLRARYPRNR